MNLGSQILVFVMRDNELANKYRIDLSNITAANIELELVNAACKHSTSSSQILVFMLPDKEPADYDRINLLNNVVGTNRIPFCRSLCSYRST